MDNVTRIPASECLTCHYKMDATQPAFDEGATPKKGDVSICAKCDTMTQFDEKFNMVALTPEELKELKAQYPDLWNELMRVQRYIHAKAKRN